MIIEAEHPTLEGQQETTLTVNIAAGATQSTVVNNTGFSANDYILIGLLGLENTEIVQVSSLAGDTTINHAATKFAHSKDDPLTRFPYNQVEFYESQDYNPDTGTGTWTLLATVNITPDQEATAYDHPTGSINYYYRVRYKNSTAGTYSSYSEVLPGSGFEFHTLRKMTERTLNLFNDKEAKFVSVEEVHDFLNEAYEDMCNKISQAEEEFFAFYASINLVAGTGEYTLPKGLKKPLKVEVSYDGSTFYRATPQRVGEGSPQASYIKSDPRYYRVFGKIGLLPVPDANVTAGLRIWYAKNPEKLANDTDTPASPLSDYTRLFILYALSKCHEKQRKTTNANNYFTAYLKGLQDMLNEIVPWQEDRPRFVDASFEFYGDSDLLGGRRLIDN